MKFALMHIPSGKVCDVEEGVCYITFDGAPQAQLHIDTELTEWAHNYEVVELPADLVAHVDIQP